MALLAAYAACLAVALLASSAASATPAPLLRSVITFEDDAPCDFYYCRPRSLIATTADCRFWCNNDSKSNRSDCARYCKCPGDAAEAGGVFCEGVCLPTLRCASGRTPRCTRLGSLQCQQT